MISFKSEGDFSKLNGFLEEVKEKIKLSNLDKYGRQGVLALRSATPKDTGKTADSWDYKIIRNNESVSISFYNTNIQNGMQIAILLQYGHATKNGGWVEGRDYINHAIRPLFDKIAEDAWREVDNA